MMPPMNATGANTATIASVVGQHGKADFFGRPAPLRDETCRARWRTMFLAHHNGIVDQQADARDSAISVSALSVKPNAYSAMKVATTEIGKHR